MMLLVTFHGVCGRLLSSAESTVAALLLRYLLTGLHLCSCQRTMSSVNACFYGAMGGDVCMYWCHRIPSPWAVNEFTERLRNKSSVWFGSTFILVILWMFSGLSVVAYRSRGMKRVKSDDLGHEMPSFLIAVHMLELKLPLSGVR